MTESLSVTVKRGSLYLGCDVYDRYFPGLDGVILLRRDDDLLILPVRHAASGGYLLKLRSAAGDRVVSAPDFFREQGIEEDCERHLAVTWSPEKGALCAPGAFKLKT